MRPPLRRDLRFITLEGATYCVMQGLGEASLPAFMLALGYGQHVAGLIATLPQFLGSILQNFSPAAILRVNSLRRFSVMTVTAQALAFLPLMVAAWTQALPLWVIFAAVGLYWAGGLSTGAAWNTWMETVVPRSIRPRYFARRNALCNLLQWSSMLLGGALLSLAARSNLSLATFGAFFLLAGLSRGAGAYVMSRQSEPEPLPKGFSVLRFGEAVKVLRHSPEGGLLLYLLAAQASLQIAVPYLAPYLLGPLHLSYWQFMGVLSTATLARITALPVLANWARRWGTRGLLNISGVGLAAVPLLWLWSSAPIGYYLGVQIFTGFLMAAYDLALMFVYLEAIPAAQRASVLTRFRLFDTLAMFGGSLVGSALLLSLGQNLGAYQAIFLLSCVARLAALRILPPAPQKAEPPATLPLPAATVAPTSTHFKPQRHRHRSVSCLQVKEVRAAKSIERAGTKSFAGPRVRGAAAKGYRKRPRSLVPPRQAPRSS